MAIPVAQIQGLIHYGMEKYSCLLRCNPYASRLNNKQYAVQYNNNRVLLRNMVLYPYRQAVLSFSRLHQK